MMPGLLWRWLILTLAITITPYLISGVRIESFGSALTAAAILGVLNVSLRPILLIITIPLTIFSLGFFILIINAFMFMLAGNLVEGVHVDSFGSAFFASLIVSIVSWIMNSSISKDQGRSTVVIKGWDRGVDHHRNSGNRNEDVIDMQQGKDGKWE